MCFDIDIADFRIREQSCGRGAYDREPRKRLEGRDQVRPRLRHLLQAAGEQDDLLAPEHDRADAEDVRRSILGQRHPGGNTLELSSKERSAPVTVEAENHGGVVGESVQQPLRPGVRIGKEDSGGLYRHLL